MRLKPLISCKNMVRIFAQQWTELLQVSCSSRTALAFPAFIGVETQLLTELWAEEKIILHTQYSHWRQLILPYVKM